MKARYNAIIILVVAGHIFTELHTLLYWVNPDTAKCYVNELFIKPGFKVEGLNVLWFMKMLEDALFITGILAAGAIQAYSRNYQQYLEWQRYSFRLYTIWCIYFVYHFFDTFMLFYDYKTSYIAYVIVLSVVSIVALFVGFYRIKRN